MDKEFVDSEVLHLLGRHTELESQHGDGNFPSGWQCENPWRHGIEEEIATFRREIDPGKYVHVDDDEPLREALLDFHVRADGVAPSDVFIGEGSSTILLAFAAWLHSNGHREVYYVPPLYFSFHYVLRLLGIRMRPVSGRHAFEADFSANLPGKKSVLLVTDPIWYAGLPVRNEIIRSLYEWQWETQSLIFVDGSFQYMKWDRTVTEGTAQLASELTIRLICPTKSLAMHGHRFAYMTLPTALRREFARTSTTLIGSSSIDTAAFGAFAVRALIEGKYPTLLTELASQRHKRLREQGRIAADWQPESGYFCFERVLSNWRETTPFMDGTFFEQQRFPDHRRINLLSPFLGLLDTNND